jgi:hypothetical protein
MTSRYTDLLANQIHACRAWMLTSLLLGVVCIGLGLALYVSSSNQRILLVPYGFNESGETVYADSKGVGSDHYIKQIALADLKMFSEYHPGTIANNNAYLFARMSQKLYQAEGEKMRQRVVDVKKENITQTFMIDKIFTATNNRIVEFRGTLKRYSGKHELLNLPVKYVFRYVYTPAGVPVLNDIQMFAEEAKS